MNASPIPLEGPHFAALPQNEAPLMLEVAEVNRRTQSCWSRLSAALQRECLSPKVMFCGVINMGGGMLISYLSKADSGCNNLSRVIWQSVVGSLPFVGIPLRILSSLPDRAQCLDYAGLTIIYAISVSSLFRDCPSSPFACR